MYEPGNTAKTVLNLVESITRIYLNTSPKDKTGSYNTEIYHEDLTGVTIKIINLDNDIQNYLNQIKDTTLVKITSVKDGISTIVYERPRSIDVNTILRFYIRYHADTNTIESKMQDYATAFGYTILSSVTITRNEMIVSVTNTDYKCKYFIHLVQKNYGNALEKITSNDTVLYQLNTQSVTEYIETITVTLTSPTRVQDLVHQYMGKSLNNTWVYSNWKQVPYIVKDLPYILTNKQLTADYSDTEFEYNITTSKTNHKLIVKNGHVYESNRVIKSSTPPIPKPRPPPVVVKPPVPKPRPPPVVVKPPVPTPRPPPVVVKPPVPTPRPPIAVVKPVEDQSSVKQYSKIEFVTQQKANNIKNKILTNLQKYFTNVSITSIKKVGDKFEYVYTVKNPPENYRDIVLQYNKAVPALAILIKKKYAHKKI
jgi:hypothetical protein